MGEKIKITTAGGTVETKGSISSRSSKSILERLKIDRWPRCVACGLVLVVVIGLALGLGIGLTRKQNTIDDEGSTLSAAASTSSTLATPTSTDSISGTTTSLGGTRTSTSYWQPTAGTTWQYVLLNPPKNDSVDVTVYDIDLFDNNAADISTLQDSSKKVICYFSAGSYEQWRDDADAFKKSDYGKALDGWAGEYWLNTNSANVRKVMAARLDLAVSKGCDGVDPDNVNVYENDTGFNLTQADSIDYVNFLADEAHNRRLAIGLKNAGAIAKHVIDKMDWEVNESCVLYNECGLLQPFISQNKPVFHVEYPEVSGMKVNAICSAPNTTSFSTIIKKLELDDWIEFCP